MSISVHEPWQLEKNQTPNWKNVRLAYRKMFSQFHLLTEPFGIHISQNLNMDLGHLIAAMDVVDRELDELESKDMRNKFATALVGFLRSQENEFTIQPATSELHERIRVLRGILCHRNIQSSFCTTIQKILAHAEAKRVETDQRQMIKHLVAEWRLSGQLPILFLGDRSTARFEEFFRVCCEAMPAIDMIQDARSDFRSGQLRIKPGLVLYVRLSAVLVRRIPRLLRVFPRRMQLIKYGLSFMPPGSWTNNSVVPPFHGESVLE